MNAQRDRDVRRIAHNTLVDAWQKLKPSWAKPPSVDEFLRLVPETIITEILRVKLETPEEILPATLPIDEHVQNFETAGYIDRDRQRIVVAQRFRLEWRRFTTAHELGHWILHPGMSYHRDRPLAGGERKNPRRPAVELEADLFAAELLMPSKYVRDVYRRSLGAPIDGREPNPDLAFRLSAAHKTKITAQDLAAREPLFRALIVAQIGAFGTRTFIPLAERFRVSPTAMAIQLLDLGLVM